MTPLQLRRRLIAMAEPQIDELVPKCWQAIRTAQAPLSMRQAIVYEMADTLSYYKHRDAEYTRLAEEWKQLVTEAGFYEAYDPLVRLTGSPDNAAGRLDAYMRALRERWIHNGSTLTTDERFILGEGSATDNWLRSLSDDAVRRIIEARDIADADGLKETRRAMDDYLALVDELLEQYPDPPTPSQQAQAAPEVYTEVIAPAEVIQDAPEPIEEPMVLPQEPPPARVETPSSNELTRPRRPSRSRWAGLR